MDFYMSKVGRGRKVQLVNPEGFKKDGWQLHQGDKVYADWDAYQKANKPKAPAKKAATKAVTK